MSASVSVGSLNRATCSTSSSATSRREGQGGCHPHLVEARKPTCRCGVSVAWRRTSRLGGRKPPPAGVQRRPSSRQVLDTARASLSRAAPTPLGERGFSSPVRPRATRYLRVVERVCFGTGFTETRFRSTAYPNRTERSERVFARISGLVILERARSMSAESIALTARSFSESIARGWLASPQSSA